MSGPTAPGADDVAALTALFHAGRLADAIVAAHAMTARFADHPFGWLVLGAALKRLRRDAEALPAFYRAVALSPHSAAAQSNLAATLRDLGRSAEAVAPAQRAIQLSPGFVEAYVNLGNALTDLGKYDDAAASHRRALELSPDLFVAHVGLGNVLARMGRDHEAVASCQRAIALGDPDGSAYHNLGVALQHLGRFDEAIASYQRALEITPDFVDAFDNLLFCRTYQPVQPGAPSLAEARQFGERVAAKARPYTEWPNSRAPERRLRVGLVSGDLGNHPVGYFLENVLSALVANPESRVDFHAYASFTRSDAISERIRACCRGWRSVANVSDADTARLIHEDGIDLLIDLAGHTEYNRLPVFAWKPAPVQATWVGYLATTGVAAIDYLIADAWTLPESAAAHFTEQIWRLPDTYVCFTPPHDDVAVLPAPARASGGITFGSFNNLAKMNGDVVACWAGILKEVPQSRLFLKTSLLKREDQRAAVARRFATHGVDASRLILEGPSPRAELLASYGRVDLALDPFPYPGITTTIEALWMGVPVLTLAGDRFISRQGVGLLRNAGLPEWIAADADDYVAKAVAHVRDLGKLAALRSRLRDQLRASPLMDAPRFATHFAAALRGMWRRWCEQPKR